MKSSQLLIWKISFSDKKHYTAETIPHKYRSPLLKKAFRNKYEWSAIFLSILTGAYYNDITQKYPPFLHVLAHNNVCHSHQTIKEWLNSTPNRNFVHHSSFNLIYGRSSAGQHSVFFLTMQCFPILNNAFFKIWKITKHCWKWCI